MQRAVEVTSPVQCDAVVDVARGRRVQQPAVGGLQAGTGPLSTQHTCNVQLCGGAEV